MNRFPTGWKRWGMRLFERALYAWPLLSETLNQVGSKDLGMMAAWHFLSRAEVEGDYAEFGVFRGETFRNACIAANKLYKTSTLTSFRGRFLAFDSFRGLPPAASTGNHHNIYREGEFCASRPEFEKSLGKLMNSGKVLITEGWFKDTLTPARGEALGLTKLALVNIDCDLYESAVHVLSFISPYLQTGTIIYFDDWFSQGSLDTGESLAAREWLSTAPHIRLVEYRNVGITGKMFIVNLIETPRTREARADA